MLVLSEAPVPVWKEDCRVMRMRMRIRIRYDKKAEMTYLKNQPGLPIALKQPGVAALYALLIYVGEFFFESGGAIGYFEAASGFALAVLLIGGRRYAWGIFFGAVAVHAITDESLWEAVIIAASDVLEAFLGAWLLTRSGKFDLRLSTLHDYLRLVLLGGCASVAVSALLVNGVLLFSGLLAMENYLRGLLHWWMSDTLGVMLITPLILVWWQAGYNGRETKQVLEAGLLLGLVILIGQVVFLGWLHDSIGQIVKGYWMFMLITWMAMCLGIRGTTIALVVISVQALWGATQGVGFFSDDIAQSFLINYWFYMLTLSLVGMSMATYVNEIKQAKLATAQRDTLIREIHHRIKNNLQGITGLLRQLVDNHPQTAESVNQTISQVQSIAAIHGLQERAPAGNLYLRELAGAVAAGVGALWQKHVVVETPQDWMPYVIEEAETVPLALILNELLSNAVKHGESAGQIRMVLEHGQPAGSARLAIHNNSQLPPDFDFERSIGTGLQLVKSLMPGMGARLSWQRQGNTVMTILELEPPVIFLEPES